MLAAKEIKRKKPTLSIPLDSHSQNQSWITQSKSFNIKNNEC